MNASRTSLLTQRIHLDCKSSLARTKKGAFRNKTTYIHSLKKRDLLFSFEESTERMYVTKIKERIKEVKTEENKETNLKIDLEVEARNKPFRSNSSQNSPGRAHIR